MAGQVLILHRVADYPAWKQVFDAAAGMRFAAGEREFTVLRAAEDPNLVVHSSTWTSLASARAFFESAELVRLRAEAGVESPQLHYLRSVESGVLEAGDLTGT